MGLLLRRDGVDAKRQIVQLLWMDQLGQPIKRDTSATLPEVVRVASLEVGKEPMWWF